MTLPNPFLPHLITPLPGPNTAELIRQDHRYLSTSYTRGYPLSIAKGEGAMVTDLDGNRFLDFCAGIAVCSTGHSHPAVVQAIKDQADNFLHMSGTDFYYEGMVTLAKKLDALSPGLCAKRVYLANSGTEAVEATLKLARFHTGRPNIISFFRSFHGRTFGSMSVTASKAIQKARFGPLLPGVFHAHYPYPYRDVFNSGSEEACVDNCLNYIRNLLFKTVVPPNEVAAFLVEPIQGEGGYLRPPASFLLGLQALAKEHGILIISDEVQAGVGRTGQFWGCQLVEGYEPHIIASAKGLASGLPLGAVIAGDCIMKWPPGAHASTFGGNPVACAAAIATLELVEGQYMANARTQGERLMTGLRHLQHGYPQLGDVRGAGLMVGVELVSDATTKAKAPKLANDIVNACFERGLLLLTCGENSIRFSPPLVITAEQTDCALTIFEDALKASLP